VQTFAAKAWPHGQIDQSLAPSKHDKQIGCCYSMLGLRAAAHIFKNAKSSPACQQLANTTGLPYLQVIGQPQTAQKPQHLSVTDAKFDKQSVLMICIWIPP